ncbi:hypothetical protein [Natronobiforma cellulositropha]|uniref:hypothetical protein n=1 Tax=Natronobiforma cellulositropha TaxID=1679076 RepID=UPI0021D58532|nr:hypothetical protein [Natronobiforma cellulositropha]
MTLPSRLASVLAALLVAVTAALGGWTLLSTLALEPADGSLIAPTVATLVLTAVVVFALFAAGARSDRWLENPYW